MNNKIIPVVLILLAVAIGSYFHFFLESSFVPDRASNIANTSYSLSGQVVSIGSGSIVAKVGKVEGDKFVTQDKSMALTPKLWFVKGKNAVEISSSNLSAYLKPKDAAVFYGWSTTDGSLTVTKIELTSTGGTPLPPPVVR